MTTLSKWKQATFTPLVFPNGIIAGGLETEIVSVS